MLPSSTSIPTGLPQKTSPQHLTGLCGLTSASVVTLFFLNRAPAWLIGEQRRYRARMGQLAGAWPASLCLHAGAAAAILATQGGSGLPRNQPLMTPHRLLRDSSFPQTCPRMLVSGRVCRCWFRLPTLQQSRRALLAPSLLSLHLQQGLRSSVAVWPSAPRARRQGSTPIRRDALSVRPWRQPLRPLHVCVTWRPTSMPSRCWIHPLQT